jgi:uncharacterized protein YndB with AHSA1/START domain
VIIERSIEIARPPEEVFAFVGDPRNDPLWCPKVLTVDPEGEVEAGPGARFSVLHRPIPLRPARRMTHTLLAWTPPGEIRWREEDGDDLFLVTYSLEPSTAGTLFTQHDDVTLATPRLLGPFMKMGIGIDVAGQLRRLRTHLEAG